MEKIKYISYSRDSKDSIERERDEIREMLINISKKSPEYSIFIINYLIDVIENNEIPPELYNLSCLDSGLKKGQYLK